MATAANDATAAGSTNSGKTPAQLMQEQHEAAESHRPTIEDVVDEDDLEHPPPPRTAVEDDAPAPVPNPGPMSAKAAGKQKATEKLGVLDTQDEEAFPSLGPAPKSATAPASRLSGWAASASKAPKTNGTASTTSRPASSGVPTPSSTPGIMTPTSSAAAVRGAVSLPGRFTDSFEISKREIDKTKTVRKVLDDAKKKFNVLLSNKETNFGNSISFIAEGPKARVTEALMYISKELTVEIQVKFEIPSSVSAQIIGRAGANIKKLESQFNVKIRIEKDKGSSTGADEGRMDVVEIKGHSAQVRQVEAQITGQARSLQPKVDVSLREIPPEFYPFIAGRHGQRVQQLQSQHDTQIQIPEYYTWKQQAPPRAGENSQAPRFVPHGDSHITISGEQAQAKLVRQELERLAEQLERELALEELACEQILHPYIVGDRGMDPLEFMEKTGCAIVVPPSHHDTEDIHIIGPRDRLDEGRNLAEELMSKKHNRAIDLNKHFQDAPQGAERHSRALAQYLQKKAIQREFQKSHSAEIVFPSGASASPSWNIITDDPQKALSARNELSKITQAYPTPRLCLVEVDPFFHPHLEQLHAGPMREQGVHLIVPENGEDPVVLVYEGPRSESPFSIPRTRPTQSELAQFEQALQVAQALLLGSIPHQGISVDDFIVPRKFHDKVRRFVNNEPKPQPPQAFPIQMEFGGPRGHQSQLAARGSPDTVFLRGPSEADIATLRSKIEEFLIEAEEDEKERGYNLTFDFPAKYNKNLIGRQGAHINQLRDKHDVQIETKEAGKVKIQGPQKKAEACKAEILRLLKGWEDEVNYVIKVEPKYHGMLVGKNGENLQKIQNKVNNEVRIDFPRVSRVADDASIADTASDVGGKAAQGADEIRIRGPKAKAEKVKDDLLSLKQYLEDNSYTASVSVAQAQIPSLLGRRGQEMEKLRADTGAQIDVPKSNESDRVTIQIKGTKQQVDNAKAELQKRSKTFDNIITRTMDVDRKHHRSLIGGGGKHSSSSYQTTS
jgi:transcription antitermination factor NusA-like protein